MPRGLTPAEGVPKGEAPIEKKKGADIFADFDKVIKVELSKVQFERAAEEEQIEDELSSYKEVVEGLSGFDAFSAEPQQALLNAEALIAWLEEGKQKGLKLGRDFTAAKARFDRLEALNKQYIERRNGLLETSPELIERLDQYFFSLPEVTSLSKQVVGELREIAIELYKGGQEEAEQRAVEAFRRTEEAEAYFTRYSELAKRYEVAPDTEEMARAQFQDRLRASIAEKPEAINRLIEELTKEKALLVEREEQSPYSPELHALREKIRKQEGELMNVRAELYIADRMVERVQKLLEEEIEDSDTRRAIFEQMPVAGAAYRTENSIGFRMHGSEQTLASASADLRKKLMMELWRTAFLLSWSNGDAQIGLNGFKGQQGYDSKPMGTSSSPLFTTYPIAIGSKNAEIVKRFGLNVQGEFPKQIYDEEKKKALSEACDVDVDLYGELAALARACVDRYKHINNQERVTDLGRANYHYSPLVNLGQATQNGDLLYRPAHRELDLKIQKETLRKLEKPLTVAELEDLNQGRGLILTAEQGAEAIKRVQREALLAIAETDRVKRAADAQLQLVTGQLRGLEQSRSEVEGRLRQVESKTGHTMAETQAQYTAAIEEAQRRAKEKDDKIKEYERGAERLSERVSTLLRDLSTADGEVRLAEGQKQDLKERLQAVMKAVEDASNTGGLFPAGDMKKKLLAILEANK